MHTKQVPLRAGTQNWRPWLQHLLIRPLQGLGFPTSPRSPQSELDVQNGEVGGNWTSEGKAQMTRKYSSAQTRGGAGASPVITVSLFPILQVCLKNKVADKRWVEATVQNKLHTNGELYKGRSALTR